MVTFCLNFQFSNALRIVEMVWNLYLHSVAQVNHRGLEEKVETNCLRDSDLIPRQSFLNTTFSVIINHVGFLFYGPSTHFRSFGRGQLT